VTTAVSITGSGKIYVRVQLLEEASSGHVHYEHQEDTNRTVRENEVISE
jgi:hypothetical protein